MSQKSQPCRPPALPLPVRATLPRVLTGGFSLHLNHAFSVPADFPGVERPHPHGHFDGGAGHGGSPVTLSVHRGSSRARPARDRQEETQNVTTALPIKITLRSQPRSGSHQSHKDLSKSRGRWLPPRRGWEGALRQAGELGDLARATFLLPVPQFPHNLLSVKRFEVR